MVAAAGSTPGWLIQKHARQICKTHKAQKLMEVSPMNKVMLITYLYDNNTGRLLMVIKFIYL